MNDRTLRIERLFMIMYASFLIGRGLITPEGRIRITFSPFFMYSPEKKKKWFLHDSIEFYRIPPQNASNFDQSIWENVKTYVFYINFCMILWNSTLYYWIKISWFDGDEIGVEFHTIWSNLIESDTSFYLTKRIYIRKTCESLNLQGILKPLGNLMMYMNKSPKEIVRICTYDIHWFSSQYM